ncbi:MAG: hypothetical protein MRZ79_20055, partial [Bacteroidia bacterium]|nr:hypothetical protein [Bacteroidia bacterium]
MHKPLITHPVLHRIVLLLGLSLLLQSCLLFSSDPSAVTINETEQQTPFELDGTVVFRSFDRWFYIKGGDSEVSIINFQNLDIDFFGEYRVSPDGTKVAFLAEGDDEILIFELPSGQVVERKTFNEDLVQISWHPNSQTLVALDRFENLR